MKNEIFFISLEHWDNTWRRNQFLANLMQVDYQVTFVGPPLPIYKILVKKINQFQKIKIKHIYKIIPERFGIWAEKINTWFYTRQANIPNKSLLWINDHSKLFLTKNKTYKKIIYDITDDWTLFDYPRPLKNKIVLQDKYLSNIADAIIVCSKQLYKKKRKYKNKLFLVKNGINIKDYKKPTSKKQGLAYFLYTGSLHEERLDINLMITLAKNHPQEFFYYVGPIFFKKKTLKKFSVFKNIVLPGAVSYKKLSDCMLKAKAFIVPHLITPFTNSLDPIKQYEYMLTNKPVIATNVSGFNDWPQLFSIAKNKNEFCKYVDKTIKGLIKTNYTRRIETLTRNTWTKRYKQIKKIINA